MEPFNDQILDSPSKNSYIGSYYQPPDRICLVSRQQDLGASSSFTLDPEVTKPNIDSKAVVDALKNLQEKIRRLELERKEAEKSYQQFAHDNQEQPQVGASYMLPSQLAAGPSVTATSGRKELDLKLQSAEDRCKNLEKQLEYMRKIVENANEGQKALTEHQALLKNQQQSSSNFRTQQEKLEKLESKCLKLSRTQTMAERKLSILEQKLLREEKQRKRVQEKAEELQKEMDINFQLSLRSNEEMEPKKKTKNTVKKTSRLNELASPRNSTCNKMPFVAGTSISPSHSVHANVQSILHMMKHHQPQLCERVSALQKSVCGAKKNLHKEFSPASTGHKKPDGLFGETDRSLSDLLLALQDELGQMGFEQQELMRLIDASQHREQSHALQRELERLVGRMEEKGIQITKLRKHQQTVHKLNESQPSTEAHAVKQPVPSLVKPKHKSKKGGTTQLNLQLLRESQQFKNSLKQDDLCWET